MVSCTNQENLEKKLVFSFLEFLKYKSESKSTNFSNEQIESLDVAIQCLSETFNLNLMDGSQKEKYSLGITTEADKKEAEEWKLKGNTALHAKQYDEAIDYYSKAIKLDFKNPVYCSNRAAAYTYLGNDEKAIEDCLRAIELDPLYSKAYTRLGHSYANINKYEESISAYKKALSLDPGNASIENSLKMVMKNMENFENPSSSTQSNNMPSSDSFAPGMSQAAADGGDFGNNGLPDFSKLLSDPMMMNMAKNLMNSGALEGLLNNPNLSRMAQSLTNSGDPSVLQNILKSFSGANGPSSSSSS